MTRMTMADVRRLHTAAGGHFFDRATMRFFNSRIESSLYQGGYFVTSEQFVDSAGEAHAREYLVRHFYAEDPRRIVTVGEPHGSKDDAVRMIRALQADAEDA